MGSGFINAAARAGSFLLASAAPGMSREQFAAWVRTSHRYISRDALTEIVQQAAGSAELHDLALEVAEIIAAGIAASHDSAETRIEDLVGLSRAIYRLSPDESGHTSSEPCRPPNVSATTSAHGGMRC